MKRTFEVTPWNIVTHDFKPEDKRLQESMTSLGNGYMGMRGFFEEDYSGDTLNGIYLGGVWYPDKTRVGWWKNGYPDYFGKVVNAVNFIKMHIKINGEAIDLAKDQFSDFELNLDMKKALLTRSFTVTKGDAKVAVEFVRFLSVAQPELSVQRVRVQNVGSNKVDLVIDSAIDGDVKNEDANYDERFWEVLSTEQGTDSGNVLAETTPNPFGHPGSLPEWKCVTSRI